MEWFRQQGHTSSATPPPITTKPSSPKRPALCLIPTAAADVTPPPCLPLPPPSLQISADPTTRLGELLETNCRAWGRAADLARTPPTAAPAPLVLLLSCWRSLCGSDWVPQSPADDPELPPPGCPEVAAANFSHLFKEHSRAQHAWPGVDRRRRFVLTQHICPSCWRATRHAFVLCTASCYNIPARFSPSATPTRAYY